MNKAWFAVKRIGYGPGLPISWEGWAVLAGFIGAAWILRYFCNLLPTEMVLPLKILGVLALLIAFLLIGRAKAVGTMAKAPKTSHRAES